MEYRVKMILENEPDLEAPENTFDDYRIFMKEHSEDGSFETLADKVIEIRQRRR